MRSFLLGLSIPLLGAGPLAWLQVARASDPLPPGAAAGNPLSHWAFQPVLTMAPPPDPGGWARHPVDCFIAARWREKGLRPVGPAERRSLLRRVFFDLVGLAPGPEEVAAFLADAAPDAFERVVERLLASPRYGERWGRHWLDVARYADTAGDNADYPVPEARIYRDYVIDSFNTDKPYDELVREQLAGDILAREGRRELYAERVAATGFLALSRRYATAPYELWHLTLEDTIDTVGQAFLGLTLRCARCHDHKYDPISMRDYYALYGIFESTQFPWAGGEELASKQFPRQGFEPLVPEAEAAPALAAHGQRVQALKGRVAALEKETSGKKNEELDRLRSELRGLERAGLPPDLPGAYAVREGSPRHACVQLRGDPDHKGPVVERGAVAVLRQGDRLGIPPGESGRRQLAAWISGADHPLTARVMANRVWQHHFGKGIVATPSNFGLRGAAPTHPELLDYLARRFVESGWSLKALHRLILSSRVWQLSSAGDAEDSVQDPANDFCWRHDRLRLDAEAIRDARMLASGRLLLERPGPHPFPPISSWGWTQHSQFKAAYPSRHRSVYLMVQRLQRHPFLALFDGPDANTTTEKRTSATVPLQALYLLNSPEAREEAEAFAARLLAASTEPRERIRLAYELAFARPPAQDEARKAAEHLERCSVRLAGAGVAAAAREAEALTSLARVLLASNELFYVD